MKAMENRYCNKPDLIKEHLRRSHDLELDINEKTIICRSCYKSFSKILKNPISLDSNLQALIATMQSEENQIALSAVDSCVQYSLLHTARNIAELLLNNEAVLLSEAYQELSATLEQTLDNKLTNQTINPSSLVTKRHLHCYLVSTLEEHLQCVTKEQSTGTILLRKGGDIMKALSRSLLRNYKHKLSKTTDKKHDDNCATETQLYNVCDELNDIIHTTIDDVLKQEKSTPLDLSTVNINDWISKTDKTLWETLVLITRTRNDRKLPVKDVLRKSLSDVRNLRLFYIVCVICFTTDNRCIIPLHTLLTDVVDTHGGTQKLVQKTRTLC